MLQVEQSSDGYILQAGDLQLAFRHVRDRWRHELAIHSGSEWKVILVSSEGGPADSLPPSPPFQDLRLETLGDDTREFQLFGQAGHGAYSAAIRFEGNPQALSFDVAARATREGAAVCMTSAYEVPPTVAIIRISEPESLFLKGDAGPKLELTKDAAAASGAATMRNDAGRITIGHVLADVSGTAPAPRNARWQYRISVSALP
jgi:hypothetical protein